MDLLDGACEPAFRQLESPPSIVGTGGACGVCWWASGRLLVPNVAHGTRYELLGSKLSKLAGDCASYYDNYLPPFSYYFLFEFREEDTYGVLGFWGFGVLGF